MQGVSKVSGCKISKYGKGCLTACEFCESWLSRTYYQVFVRKRGEDLEKSRRRSLEGEDSGGSFLFLGPAGVAAAPGRSAAAKASRLSTRASEQGAVAGTRASAAPADLSLLFFFVFPLLLSEEGRETETSDSPPIFARAIFMGRDS